MEDGGWTCGSHDCHDRMVGGDVAGVIGDAINAVGSSVDVDDMDFTARFGGEDPSDDVIGNEATATGDEDGREGLGVHDSFLEGWKVGGEDLFLG
jgi:hypothetical protein